MNAFRIDIVDSLKHDDQQNGKLIPARMMKIMVPRPANASGVEFFHCDQETIGL